METDNEVGITGSGLNLMNLMNLSEENTSAFLARITTLYYRTMELSSDDERISSLANLILKVHTNAFDAGVASAIGFIVKSNPNRDLG